MKIDFCCPKCDRILQNSNEIIKCDNCKNKYSKIKNFYDFSDGMKINNKKKEKISYLLKCINGKKYDEGIKQFIKKFPMEKQYLINTKFDQSIDSIFHCLNKNFKNCLVIGNDYGNIAEILSKIFESVYLLEYFDEQNQFQKKRVEYLNLENIVCIKTNKMDLPFDKNSFDLILFCNEHLYDEFNKHNTKISNSKYLQKIKEILTERGCLCLSLENKFGSNYLSNEKKSNLSNQKRLKFSEYAKLLQQLNFKIRPFWGLPSEERPYFSGLMNDDISLRWYFKNLTSFMKGTKIKAKHKISFFLLKNMPKYFGKFLMQNFIPFFILCCYKNEICESIEDSILRQTKSRHCLMLSRRIKIIFIVFDNLGKPKFIINWKRYGKEIPEKILLHKRQFTQMGNPKERVWMEEWKKGITLNPFNHDEVIVAINWLTNFQKNTIDQILHKEDLSKEFQMIGNVIENESALKNTQYNKWLNEYKLFIEQHNIKKSSVHGDFWYANMLYDNTSKSVNLIDWENYIVCGNPFHDLTTFIMRWMMMSKDNQVETFKMNLTKNEKFQNLLNEVQKIVNQHFGFTVDFNILLRYLILRNVSKLANIKNSTYYKYLEMLKILENHKLLDGEFK